MQCNSKKWCGWLQTFSQIAIAVVIVYAGYIVNKHMEAWTNAFTRGSDDLHEIQQSMKRIEQQMYSVNNQMYYMNGNVHEMRNRMNPMGMMRSMMPW